MINILPVPGQRWVSESEPELGLGIILKVATGRVEIMFPAADERRQYALSSAPLLRVVFKQGDRITLHDGAEHVVQSVEDRAGLLVYQTTSGEVQEAELSDTISFSSPEERLLAGHVDDVETFDLRAEALRLRSRIQQSPVRGYVGGRIDLIAHQLSIAGEVSSRLSPRVLLADEVGLGKTIEAGLILHRLHLTGRAERVLILVPEPLVNQWFVELLRRFNLPFNIYDEERCAALEESDPDGNPFLDSQLVLCSIELLSGSRSRAALALEAGWDLLVVDEAHHLEWSRQKASNGYRLVEALASTTSGLLLLTATPQQLGPEGHFARLRLLDPDRYADLDLFLAEAEQYETVARAVEHILDGEALTTTDLEFFAGHSERIRRLADAVAQGLEGAREQLVAGLLDSFGTGRVMFRNTRAALTGFPERRAWLVQLEPGLDPMAGRVEWLADLLRKLPDEKLLLICRTRELAEQIHARLQLEINVKAALFHEGLTLIQRDRNAAYFAEEEGARILICSEIGSEGRNFQFAHHLVLFDLPSDPELLEQRIGRLDRIGQTATVNIHVPWLAGTESEVLARWYHEGLNAFEENLHGAADILHSLDDDVAKLLERFDAQGLDDLIERSREEQKRVAEKLEHGYDRLLQLNSNKPEKAEELTRQIRAADRDRSFETFVVRLLEYYGVHAEEFAHRTYHFKPGNLLTDAFPPLPDEGLSVTFDRQRALGRDDLGFVTWDHPFIRSVIDLLVDGEQGNASFGLWNGSGEEGILLEVHAIIEAVAPASLHVDRFLPQTPVRIVVDHEGTDLSDDPALKSIALRNGDPSRLLDKAEMKSRLIPSMLAGAMELAEEKRQAIITGAIDVMNLRLGEEIERLEDLHQINSNVRVEEIEAAREQRSALEGAIRGGRLRVGGLRLVLRMV